MTKKNRPSFLLHGLPIVLSLLVLSLLGCGAKNSDVGNAESKGRDKSSRDHSMDLSMPIIPSAPGEEIGVRPHNTEAYDHIVENEFRNALNEPQSTFGIDVDTASYSNVRRLLNSGVKPPHGAVRIEEMINYFSYRYPRPTGPHPFSVQADLAPCPWENEHQIVRIALQGKRLESDSRPTANIVFLLDVSGSMSSPEKLPLVKSAIKLLVENLEKRDQVSIVVYAGASGVVLPPTSAKQRNEIFSALDRLDAGGSTDGGQGIQLAYQLARQQFVDGGINRVVLCTDGDFNIGITNQSDLVDLIQEQARSNIFLSVLGFGTGNYKDSTMEALANKGNGNYAYIDTLLEAHKTLVQQLQGTLVTIAKDVKIQVDFNPARVHSYRLIGYENRMLNNEDFDDDSKDAGEIGAGHSVTALYEIVPVDSASLGVAARESEFVEKRIRDDVDENVVLKVALRYKQPDADVSRALETRLIHPQGKPCSQASGDLEFASAVAAFGMILRDSKFLGSADLDWVIETAEANLGEDEFGFRAEFVQLAKKARLMTK